MRRRTSGCLHTLDERSEAFAPGRGGMLVPVPTESCPICLRERDAIADAAMSDVARERVRRERLAYNLDTDITEPGRW